MGTRAEMAASRASNPDHETRSHEHRRTGPRALRPHREQDNHHEQRGGHQEGPHRFLFSGVAATRAPNASAERSGAR